MQIRQATAADVPAVVEMACAFYRTAHYTEWALPDDASIKAQAESMAADHVLLLAEKGDQVVGMVALYVVPFMFNANVLAAFEAAFWVDPDHRGSRAAWQLLQSVEPACSERGCASVSMTLLESSPPQVRMMYERLGFTKTETSYTKVLKWAH